jgi:hypothetical protein
VRHVDVFPSGVMAIPVTSPVGTVAAIVLVAVSSTETISDSELVTYAKGAASTGQALRATPTTSRPQELNIPASKRPHCSPDRTSLRCPAGLAGPRRPEAPSVLSSE